MNASTATIYRHAEDRPQTESSGELGEGFSVSIAKAWEQELFADELPTRRIALRMAIVLGHGSALTPLLRLARFGLGGPQLDGPWWGTREKRSAGAFHQNRSTRGHQRFSWVHIADVLGAVDFLRDHAGLEGPVNVSSPNPVEGIELMRTLRHIVGMPIGLATPRPLLEAGTFLLRTETELVLKSRWVLPERLERAGYRFAFPELEPAVRDIVQGSASRKGSAA
jgi:NAD dependent epimerase/dehydratase family enzyme